MLEISGYAEINRNVVEFSGRSRIGKHGNKFVGFSQGQLIIEETVSEFEVYPEANSPGWILLLIFTSPNSEMIWREKYREIQSDNGHQFSINYF